MADKVADMADTRTSNLDLKAGYTVDEALQMIDTWAGRYAVDVVCAGHVLAREVRRLRSASETKKDDLFYHRGFNDGLDLEKSSRRLLQPSETNGWRPTENFLPEVGFSCLVADAEAAAECLVVGEAVWHGQDEGWYWAGNDPTDSWGGRIYPTHWMPMPAGPDVKAGGST